MRATAPRYRRGAIFPSAFRTAGPAEGPGVLYDAGSLHRSQATTFARSSPERWLSSSACVVRLFRAAGFRGYARLSSYCHAQASAVASCFTGGYEHESSERKLSLVGPGTKRHPLMQNRAPTTMRAAYDRAQKALFGRRHGSHAAGWLADQNAATCASPPWTAVTPSNRAGRYRAARHGRRWADPAGRRQRWLATLRRPCPRPPGRI